jgi:hypothetical protein
MLTNKAKFPFFLKSYLMKGCIGMLLFILITTGSCNSSKTDNPDYQVYSTILSSFKARTLIIRKHTTPLGNDYDYNTLVQKMPLLEEDTFYDFWKKVNIPDTLDYLFTTKKQIFLLTDEEIQKALLSPKEYFGIDTYKKIGKIQGTTTFSRIGFNKSRTQALVCDWTQTGELAGSGYFSLYKRKYNKWKLIYNRPLGIS